MEGTRSGEVRHTRDWSMVAPWAMCGAPMSPVLTPGARECWECREALDAMCSEAESS